MRLALAPTQQDDRVPIHALSARIDDLPCMLAALARAKINMPGCTADHLLRDAEDIEEAVRECRLSDRGRLLEAECATWIDLAGILRDAAPHRQDNPPRIPANAQDSAATMTRREQAAGLATCGGPG